MSWKPILAVIGSVAGGAAWVSVVGSVVMAERLSSAGVAPSSAVSLVPVEHRFVVGMRFLAIPLLIAVVVFLALYFARDRDHGPDDENVPGREPRGARSILGALAAAGLILTCAFADGTAPVAQALLGALSLGVPLLIWFAVKRCGGFTEAGVIIFVAVAFAAGLGAYLYERGRDPRMELAVAAEKSGATTGGYYLTKTGDSVYLITAVRPSPSNALLGPETGKCSSKRTVEAIMRRDDCYFRELVAIPSSEVSRLLVGPRGVPVDRRGFNAVRLLAARLAEKQEDVKKTRP